MLRPAHAKVNLTLRVHPPRDEPGPRRGWHEIESWFHAIDLADGLSFERLAQGEPSRLSIEWAEDAPRPSAFDWRLDRDLVFRAHRALEERAGGALPAEIRVLKRIPVGSGLGGGSSDAACCLIALNELFDLGLDPPTLREIGAMLGSDVGFFLDQPRGSDAGSTPRPAFITGFGDRIERMGRTEGTLALILPRIGCSTPEVYGAFDALLGSSATVENVAGAVAPRASGRSPRSDTLRDVRLHNDLVRPALSIEPDLAALHRTLTKQFGPERVHMSGSGSTLFIVLDDPADPRLETIRRIADGHGAAVRISHLV